jgi:hypothetical protein
LQAELTSLKRQIAAFTINDPALDPSDPAENSRQPSPEVSRFQEEKTIEKIRQLGGKFAIMYMLWMSNTQAAFQTKPNPEYVPMSRFEPGLEWKRQGELADLLQIFPEEYHKDFAGDFIHPIVSSLILCRFLTNL